MWEKIDAYIVKGFKPISFLSSYQDSESLNIKMYQCCDISVYYHFNLYKFV